MEEFTAVIISYNDAERLAYTLESLKDFKNVVVIDKHSTDNTQEVVARYNRKCYLVDYHDSYAEKEQTEKLREIWYSLPTEWIFDLTCSDIIHPDLQSEMTNIINSGSDVECVYIPIYRYSMGFTSKYSYFHDLGYQAKLFKKHVYNFDISEVHANCLRDAKKVEFLKPKNPKAAIYHLTHENLEMVMERHLRYARVEAEYDLQTKDRKTYLDKSWRSVLRVPYTYFKLRTYKLKDAGKAQFCMLMLYRCANFLNLYFSKEKEKEIKDIYDGIRNGSFFEKN